MDDIKIIDNFLEKDLFSSIANCITSNEFQWYFQNDISGKIVTDDLGDFGFSHVFYKDGETKSDWFEDIIPFVNKVLNFTDSVEILRARGDLTLYNKDCHKHKTHVDLTCENTTAILYITNSDGNTILYDQHNKFTDPEKIHNYIYENEKDFNIVKEIEPVANRLVVFNGLRFHTGHSPTKHKRRILLNINVR